jgi:hypothetical protein
MNKTDIVLTCEVKRNKRNNYNLYQKNVAKMP